MLHGQATKNVTFFIETDDFKIGSQGPAAQYSSSTTVAEDGDETTTDDATHSHTATDSKGTFIQDAYISYKIADEFQISAGMMILPFMHHSRQSAVSLLGVDYNVGVVPLGGTTNVWRDTGVEIRGLLFETAAKKQGLFDYRIGVYRGPAKRDMNNTPESNDDINPHSYLRYSGRLQLNIVDSETGFFYSGN